VIPYVIKVVLGFILLFKVNDLGPLVNLLFFDNKMNFFASDFIIIRIRFL